MNRLSSVTATQALQDEFGKRPALIDAATNESWSYEDLQAQVENWLGFFQTRQLKQGDVVVWIAKNRLDFFAILFAAREAGLTLLPLNWRESLTVQLSILNLAQPALLVYDGLFKETAVHLQRLRGASAVVIDDVVSVEWPIADPTPMASDQPWYLLFTSGTTGVPKAVIYTWDMHLANVHNVCAMIDLGPDDQTLSALPHYHTAGINLFALPVLMKGGSVRLHVDPEPIALLQDLEHQPVTVLLLVPTLYQKIADCSGFTALNQRAKPFRLLASGGAPLSHSLWQQWADQGLIIRNGCGLTESGPTLFLQTEQEAIDQPTAIGNTVPGTEVRLVGPDGTDVNLGETGEFWIKGASVTPGYWRNTKANNLAFRDGWFRTGDLGRQDEQQYQIVDRLNDMYICGGENVYPNEIEDLLLKYHGIEEVVVMGESHRIWGETGVAFVVQRPGYFLTTDEVMQFCRARLARYKVPKRIEFVDELPKTATGKIRRGIVQSWVRQ